MSVIPYNTDTISNEIHTEWAGKTVHFAKEIDSTNEWCKRLSKEDAVHGHWRLQNSSLPVREDSDADGLCRRGIRL